MGEVKSEIMLCNKCNGSGQILERISVDDDELHQCYTCKGTGRLIKTTTITIKPFKEEK